MKFSAGITLWLGVVFTVVTAGYGAYGWLQLVDMPPGQARDDARGYVMYWMFLGVIGAACAVVSWWIARTEKD